MRNLRRAVEKPTSAAGMVKELQEILAVLPGAEAGPGELEGRSSIDIQTRSAALIQFHGATLLDNMCHQLMILLLLLSNAQ